MRDFDRYYACAILIRILEYSSIYPTVAYRRAGIKLYRPNDYNEPWMNRKVLRMISKKRRLWKHYTSSKDCARDYRQFEAYKKVQDDVRKAVKKAKKEFEKKLAKNAKKNSKMCWSYMKQKTCNRVSVGPLVRDKVVITDNKEMCDVLNQQYCLVLIREDLNNLPGGVRVGEELPLQ